MKNLGKIANTFGRMAAKVKLKAIKHAPELLTAAGIVGTAAATVLACKETTKISTILDKAEHDLKVTHEAQNDPEFMAENHYTKEDAVKDLTVTYVQTGVKLAKLYAPSILLYSASIACILTGHGILKSRNAALAAGMAAFEQAFQEYRGRVADKYGREAEHDIYYNVREEEHEVPVEDDMGNVKMVNKKVKVADDFGLSPYRVLFDESNPNWDRNPMFTMMFLESRLQTLNDKLRAQHYLFLNDVYDELGIDRKPLGQLVGWIYDPTVAQKDADGDQFVDFGIDQEAREAMEAGEELSLWLEFNVQGNILEMIDKV